MELLFLCVNTHADDDNGRMEFKRAVTMVDDDDDSPYSRIEVYYPFRTLSVSTSF